MIVSTAHISSVNANDFNDKITQAIDIFQKQDLTVEIQYHPVCAGLTTIYTALLLGRKKGGESND